MLDDNKLKVKLVNRIDTKENWSSVNPILLEGEFGIEKDGDAISGFKIGDGKTAWNDLKYTKMGDSGSSDAPKQDDSIDLNGPGVVTFDLGENQQPKYKVKPEDKILRFINSSEKKIDLNKVYTDNDIYDLRVESVTLSDIDLSDKGTILVYNDTERTTIQFIAPSEARSFTISGSGWNKQTSIRTKGEYIYLVVTYDELDLDDRGNIQEEGIKYHIIKVPIEPIINFTHTREIRGIFTKFGEILYGATPNLTSFFLMDRGCYIGEKNYRAYITEHTTLLQFSPDSQNPSLVLEYPQYAEPYIKWDDMYNLVAILDKYHVFEHDIIKAIGEYVYMNNNYRSVYSYGTEPEPEDNVPPRTRIYKEMINGQFAGLEINVEKDEQYDNLIIKLSDNHGFITTKLNPNCPNIIFRSSVEDGPKELRVNPDFYSAVRIKNRDGKYNPIEITNVAVRNVWRIYNRAKEHVLDIHANSGSNSDKIATGNLALNQSFPQEFRYHFGNVDIKCAKGCEIDYIDPTDNSVHTFICPSNGIATIGWADSQEEIPNYSPGLNSYEYNKAFMPQILKFEPIDDKGNIINSYIEALNAAGIQPNELVVLLNKVKEI